MTQQQYNFHNIYTRFDDQFTPPLPSHVSIHIPDAEQRLRAGLDYFVRQFTCGMQHAQWHEENYRPIVQWMNHNHGRGLILTGTCGLGKTLIGKYILPLLIRDTTRRIVNIFTARDLQARPDEIMTIISMHPVTFPDRDQRFFVTFTPVEKYLLTPLNNTSSCTSPSLVLLDTCFRSNTILVVG